MSTSPKSYAEVVQHRTSPMTEYFPGILPSTERRISAVSSSSHYRSPSVSSNTEVIPENSTGTLQLPRASSPPFPEQLEQRRPSLTHDRRPSIAQVMLNRIGNRGSFHSDTSRLSYSGEVSSVYDEPEPVRPQRRKKKSKNKNKNKASQSRGDHGEFIASRRRSVQSTTTVTENPSPLLLAIRNGNLEDVRALIADENVFLADDMLPNKKGLLPEAALSGHEDIVKLLLDTKQLDVNAKDSKERTAMFAATSRGHDSIVKILLSYNAKPLSIEEFRIAHQELRSVRAYEAQRSLQTKGSPLRYSTTVEGSLIPTVEGASVTSEPESETDSRSLHISISGRSNDGEHLYKLHVSSVENVKQVEEAINHDRQEAQAKGEWVKGPIKSPPSLLPEKEFTVKHARYPGFGFEIPIVEFDFSENGGHRIISPTLTVDELLYGPKSLGSMFPSGSTTTRAPCRWYHLPANHLGWAEDLIRKIYENRSSNEQRKRDVILRREPFATGDLDHTNPTLLDPRPQARSLRPLCRNMTLDRDGTQKLSSALALHVPYVHWETEISRGEMAHVMEQVRRGRIDELADKNCNAIPDINAIRDHLRWTKNEKLLCAYLYNNPPVHPRRTLDQFYYHMLEDTEQRDTDQVITRYYENVWKRSNLSTGEDETNLATSGREKPKYKFILNSSSNIKDPPEVNSQASPVSPTYVPSFIEEGVPDPRYVQHANAQQENFKIKDKRNVMMVDQLWLWILDDNTIITSFPQNWSHDNDGHGDESDPMDVLKSIQRYLTLVNRPPLESIYDLAQLVVYKCLATFCRKSTPYGAMQILDVYESAIAAVTDQESKIFSEFAMRSKQSPRHDPAHPQSHEHAEDMYSIDKEIQQLKEIKDIQDELHILSVLLDNQKTVLKAAILALKQHTASLEERPKTPRSPIPGTPGTPGDGTKESEFEPYSAANNFDKLYLMVDEQDIRRKGLEEQAERAINALNHLLDLKQKQANVSEARSARWTAESTKQQGSIMVLFTLVTIIFAPLTLIVTIFSLRIVEFPDTLHFQFVLKYMFGVSVAIIVPLLGVVVYTTRLAIRKLIIRIASRLRIMRSNIIEWWEEDRDDGGKGSRSESRKSLLVNGHDNANIGNDTEEGRKKNAGGLGFWWRNKKGDGKSNAATSRDAEKGEGAIIHIEANGKGGDSSTG